MLDGEPPLAPDLCAGAQSTGGISWQATAIALDPQDAEAALF
jgi:hypothetical protein